MDGEHAQIVFVDTPGVHKSDTIINRRMMQTVRAALDAVDVVLLVIDATRRPGEEESQTVDLVKKAGTPVMLLNETMARRFFGAPASAVGQSMVVLSGRYGQDETVQVVGVIGDVRHLGLREEPIPELFRPMTQTFMFPMAMIARTAGPPEQIAAAVRQAAFEIDPVVPVAEMQPYTTLIAGTLGRPSPSVWGERCWNSVATTQSS